MESAPVRYYEFGDFCLDARRRILLKNGEQIPLSGRICDLLLVLIRNEGQTLSHDELLDAVWEGAFVEQSNLKKSISTLRQILGERPNESFFIKTVPRRGYAFVAPVRIVPDDPENVSGQFLSNGYSPIEIAPAANAEKTEFVPAIGEITPESDSIPAAPVRSSSWKVLFPLGAVVVLCLIAAAASYVLSPGPVRFSVDKVQVQTLTNDGNYFDSSVSADGNYLVHAFRQETESSLILHQLAAGSNSKLISYPDASFWAYSFTPDGNFIYYMVRNWAEPNRSGVYRIPFLGGEPKLIYSTLASGALTFSPDGRILAMARTDEAGNPEVMVMSADGSDPRRVVAFEKNCRIWSLRFTPDASGLLFALRRETPDQKNVYSVRTTAVADGRETIVIPEQERVIQGAAWTADGKSLLLLVREPNAEIRQIWQYIPGSNEWIRVTNDNESYKTLFLLADGRSIVSTRESVTSSILTAQGEPHDFRQVTGGINQYGHTGWTADGRLVYLSVENKAEVISIMSAAGRNKQVLTSGNDGMWMQPTVSGDGRSIVFLSNRSGTSQLWRMGLNGGDPVMLTRSDSSIFFGRLLSDGETLIFQKNVIPVGWMLYKQVGQSEAVPVSDVQIGDWDLSPDEKQVAFWREDPKSRTWNVAIMSLADGQITKTLDGLERGKLRWTRDGKGLAYISAAGGHREIRVRGIDGSATPRTVATVPSDNLSSFEWSADGTKLVLVQSRRLADAVKISLNEGR